MIKSVSILESDGLPTCHVCHTNGTHAKCNVCQRFKDSSCAPGDLIGCLSLPCLKISRENIILFYLPT